MAQVLPFSRDLLHSPQAPVPLQAVSPRFASQVPLLLAQVLRFSRDLLHLPHPPAPLQALCWRFPSQVPLPFGAGPLSSRRRSPVFPSQVPSLPIAGRHGSHVAFFHAHPGTGARPWANYKEKVLKNRKRHKKRKNLISGSSLWRSLSLPLAKKLWRFKEFRKGCFPMAL